MLGEPPRPPAANADDDATSNPSTAAHNKLIFVIGGVPLLCRKRPAFLINPRDKSDFVRSGTVEYYPHGTTGLRGTSGSVNLKISCEGGIEARVMSFLYSQKN